MSSLKTFVIPTDFETFFKPFTRVFQTLCVSHYSVFRPKLQKSFWRSLPFLLYFMVFASVHISYLTFNLSKGLFHSGHERHKESPLMFYINCLSIFGTFATHATIHLETLLSGKKEREIHEKLKKINDIFALKLNHEINYTERRAKYVRKTLLLFIFAACLSAASSFIHVPIANHDKYFNQRLLILAVIVIRSRGFHIALFLNTISDTLVDLQFILKEQQIKSRQRSGSIPAINFRRDKIRAIREVYSNVWLVKTLMSDCFGWTLITFLVEFSIEVINSSYWFYINLKKYESNSFHIRKMQQFTVLHLK